MKFILITCTLLMALPVLAGVSEDVSISGKLGSEFTDKQVKVTDSFGQTYFLDRKHFPADFKFTQGAAFTIQVPEQEFNDVVVINKK